MRTFLEKKKVLRNLFRQEYPENPIDAFITSGDTYFDRKALEMYLNFSEKYKHIKSFKFADQII